MDISQDRSRQPATSSGLGIHFTSPVKKRPPKQKSQVMMTTTFDAICKRQCLQAEVEAMLATELPIIPEEEAEPDKGVEEEGHREELSGHDLEPFNSTNRELPEGFDHGFLEVYPEHSTNSGDNVVGNQEPKNRRHITSDQVTIILYDKWKALLLLLLDDLLAYTTASVGAAVQTVGSKLQGPCHSPSTCSKSLDLKATKVTCLYFDHKIV